MPYSPAVLLGYRQKYSDGWALSDPKLNVLSVLLFLCFDSVIIAHNFV